MQTSPGQNRFIQPAQSPAQFGYRPGTYPKVGLPGISESPLKDSLITRHTLTGMWIDDTNADVIKVDFDALYHGDYLVEGETSEQVEEWFPLPAAV